MTHLQKSTRTLNKMVASHLPPSHSPFCVCIRDFTKLVLEITKQNKNLPPPPSSLQNERLLIININDIEINSLNVENTQTLVEDSSIGKGIPVMFKNLCQAELVKYNIENPTFQWDIKGQSKWDEVMISVIVKHWFFAKGNQAFLNYPIQSDLCNQNIVAAILERWLRGQKASYLKNKKPKQNLSRMKNKVIANLTCMMNFCAE